MANTLLTASMITREALMVLENSLSFTKGVNREYDDKFGVDGAKIGDTLNIRKPAQYVGRTGTALSVEDTTETSVALQLSTQFGVDVNFTSKELGLSIDDFSKRILKPAMATIANKIDYDGLSLYKDIYNTVGTPGTVPNALLTYLQAGQKLNEEAAPADDERSMIVNPAMQVSIVDALKGLQESGPELRQQYRRGKMATAVGFNWAMDQNIRTHVVGAYVGTPLVNGSTSSGATTVVTDGWTGSVTGLLKQGDVITIAGVYAVNPQSRQSTGSLRQFVVTADVNSSSGAATIPVSPAIVSSGAFQTVSALPADNAAITVLGAASTSTPQGLAHHRDAFVLGTADLPLPKGVDMAERIADPQLGISLRLVRQYDINNDKFPCRFDVLYGWKTVRAELACRVAS